MGYNNGNVSVDDRFARFGSKSFAINKINSVEVRQATKKGGKGFIGLWAIAGLLVISSLNSPSPAISVLVAAGLAFLGWRSYVMRHDTHRYSLFLVTSSSEAQAFETSDADEIGRLRMAVEEAMSRST